MDKLITIGRIFYGSSMALLGIHQLIYTNFSLMLFPAWPAHIPGLAIIAWVFSLALIYAGLMITIGKNVRLISLVLGGVLLVMLIFFYVPYELFVDPAYKHLGVWPLKELGFAGGAFVIAGCYPFNRVAIRTTATTLLERLIPLGPLFFCINMVCFGIDHFLYTAGIAVIIPDWIPFHTFWTYVAAVALIASGIGIALNICRKLAAILLGSIIFIWLLVLHIPGAIKFPLVDQGNLVTSAFSALTFSGTAFAIAGKSKGYKLNS